MNNKGKKKNQIWPIFGKIFENLCSFNYLISPKFEFLDKKCRFRNSDSYLVHCICLYHISTASSPIQVSTFHGQLKSKSNFNHHQHGIASKFFYEFSYLFCPLHQTHFRMKTCPDCCVQTKRIVTIPLLKRKEIYKNVFQKFFWGKLTCQD